MKNYVAALVFLLWFCAGLVNSQSFVDDNIVTIHICLNADPANTGVESVDVVNQQKIDQYKDYVRQILGETLVGEAPPRQDFAPEMILQVEYSDQIALLSDLPYIESVKIRPEIKKYPG